jgi:hypothetical protein
MAPCSVVGNENTVLLGSSLWQLTRLDDWNLNRVSHEWVFVIIFLVVVIEASDLLALNRSKRLPDDNFAATLTFRLTV